MINCSRCKAALPDWAQVCQFCQTDVTSVARPAPEKKVDRGYRAANWVWTAYYLVAGWWLLGGLLQVLLGFGIIGEGSGPITGTVGAFFMLMGLGLILNIDLIRGIANILAFLKIIFGLFDVVTSLLATAVLGPLGLLMTFLGLLDLISGIMIIY
jgi:hypothetical protein